MLKMARQKTYAAYPAIVDLPSHVKSTSNYVPKLPPKLLKSKHASALSVPKRTSGPDGSLLPLKVVLHAGRPSPYSPAPTYAKNEKERNKIVEEDRLKAHGEMRVLAMRKDVIKLERKEKSIVVCTLSVLLLKSAQLERKSSF